MTAFCEAGTTLTHREALSILSGSFKSASLYLLAFSPSLRKLSLQATFPAYGPHQYLAHSSSSNTVYATTWSSPALYSFSYDLTRPDLNLLNSAPITSISSYITLLDNFAYSSGGHTGETHEVLENGKLGKKVQECVYGISEDELKVVDKSQKALRVGGHAIEFSHEKAFVPHLGRNSIFVYKIDPKGQLVQIDEVVSPNAHAGPRHIMPSPDGTFLFSISEHLSTIEVYRITKTSLSYVSSHYILPPFLQSQTHRYRGDTLRLSPLGTHLLTTTRGTTSETKGYLTIFPLSQDGLGEATQHWETPSWAGKANAIEVHSNGWVVLTDDSVEEGGVYILEWSNLGVVELVDGVKWKDGASHAIWLD